MDTPKIKGGYVLLPRIILDSPIMNKPPLYYKVWEYLLLNAQHRDYKGLKRGQLFTSIPRIQEAMSWTSGFRKETPSKKQIFGILEWLRNPNGGNAEVTMIVTTKVTHGMIVTICHYNDFQDSSAYEGNNEGNDGKPMEVEAGEQYKQECFKNDKNLNKDKSDKSDSLPYLEVISYLNSKAGKNFRNVESNKKLIRARFKEGYSLEDFKKVIDVKCNEWLNNDDMKKYLQPSTLFGPKFDNYLNELPKQPSKPKEDPAKRII